MERAVGRDACGGHCRVHGIDAPCDSGGAFALWRCGRDAVEHGMGIGLGACNGQYRVLDIVVSRARH